MLNWNVLQFYAQNELISNLMPATGLKIVGTGACLPCVASPLHFKTVWRRLIIKVIKHQEFLEYWCWNSVSFLPDIGFRFSFNDALNVLCRWKIWTAGRPIQHLDSEAMLFLIAAVCGFVLSCWNKQGLLWNIIRRGADVALKPLYTVGQKSI